MTQGVQVRSFYYDSLNRLTKAVNPESGTVCYGTGANCSGGYDKNGNLLTKADARGVTTTLTYDELNRPLTKGYTGITPTTPAVSWIWDTVRGGSLTSMVAGIVTTSYGSYDALGRATASTQSVTGYTCGGQPCTFLYSWGKAGGLSSYVFPSTRMLTYTPDAAGRTASVAAGATTYASLTMGADPANSGVQLAGYASHGGVQRLALGNGLIERTGYNSRQQPVSIQLGQVGTPSSISGLGIYYCAAQGGSCNDNNGSVRSMTIGPLNVTQSFTYDKLDRLATASEAPTAGGAAVWSETYGNDRYGNWWTVTASNPGLTYTTTPMGTSTTDASAYNAANNRFALDNNYDASGNRLVESPYTLSYDGENRMVKAAGGVNGTTDYTYDGEGRRVLAVQSDGTWRLYAYDAMGQMAVEYSNAEQTVGTQYVSVDQLGSTRVVTDSAGSGVRRYDYLPYGRDLKDAGAANRTSGLGYGMTAPRVKFTGQERDAESGLDYFEARYLSSAQGRFTTPDSPLLAQRPVDPQSWNLYSYTRNNPLRYVDPDGHQETPPQADCNGNQECIDGVNEANALFVRGVGKGLVNGAAAALDFLTCPICRPSEAPLPTEGVAEGTGNVVGSLIGGAVAGKAAGAALDGVISATTTETQFVSKDVVFTHFTDAKGLKGITGLDSSRLGPGQSTVVRELRFGFGSNPYNANAPGDNFVTSLPPSASSLQLSQMGIVGARQTYAITFSGTSAAARGTFVRGTNLPNIYTVPANTVLRGCANVFCLK